MTHSSSAEEDAQKARVRAAIIKEVFVRGEQEPIGGTRPGAVKRTGWLFDFRRALMRPQFMTDVATLFWEEHKKKYPFQIGGIEVAAIPLITGITQHVFAQGKTDVTSFFIRKSRKKSGLMRMIEGVLMPGRPVILVDDIMNSGSSFIRQVEVLHELGYKVAEVWCILRFRDESFYRYFSERGIATHSLFELNDFTEQLPVQNLTPQKPMPQVHPYRGVWKFKSEDPNYLYVVAKSDPVIDDDRLYVGSDAGYLYALNLSDGHVAWSFRVGFPAKGKTIFSSPALTQDMVIFGAYDGNVYALDKNTGKRRWVFFGADYVGSSPVVAEDLNMVFIGLEFGLVRKLGGIAALDVKTGALLWQAQHPAFTHATPLYIRRTREVAIGSNDGVVRLYDAKTGALRWECATGKVNPDEITRGFSRHDVKDAPIYDAKRDLIIVGTMDGALVAIHRKSGKERFRFKARFGIYSAPVLYRDTVIFNSLDKNTYCVDLHTFTEKWRQSAGARIFSSPLVVGERVYIGANTGRFTELDAQNGTTHSFMTFPERITNRAAYDPRTKRFYIPTFANEVYCIERSEAKSPDQTKKR